MKLLKKLNAFVCGEQMADECCEGECVNSRRSTRDLRRFHRVKRM